MNVTDKNIAAPAKTHQMDLVVEQAGPLSIVVRAGSLRFAGVAGALDADATFDVATRGQAADLVAYVVRNVVTKALGVLLDEVVLDGVDAAYAYRRGDPHELLAHLFTVRIPADTTELDAVNLTKYALRDPKDKGSAPVRRASTLASTSATLAKDIPRHKAITERQYAESEARTVALARRARVGAMRESFVAQPASRSPAEEQKQLTRIWAAEQGLIDPD